MIVDLQKESTYKVKKKRSFKKEPLWDKDGNITRDIGFELTFGFKDTTDTIMYRESYGLEETYTPKIKEIYHQ